MSGIPLKPRTHPPNWLVNFWGQHQRTWKGHPAFRKDCCCQHPGAFLLKGPPSRRSRLGTGKQTKLVRESSAELALLCLQVLADRRNVRDNYYPTQERPAQPSNIWKEASTQRRARETSSCGCFLRLREDFRPALAPIVNNTSHCSVGSCGAQGIQCKGRVYLPVQTQWHFSKYHLCPLPLTDTHSLARSLAGER